MLPLLVVLLCSSGFQSQVLPQAAPPQASLPAQRKTPSPVLTPEQEIEKFLPIYAEYARYLQQKSASGLKTLLASDFTLRWGTQLCTGAKAVQKLSKAGSELKTTVYSVRVERIALGAAGITALTKETGVFEVQEPRSAKITLTADWYWKHLWRKTPSGWKLALMEQRPSHLEPAEGEEASHTFTSAGSVPVKRKKPLLPRKRRLSRQPAQTGAVSRAAFSSA